MTYLARLAVKRLLPRYDGIRHLIPNVSTLRDGSFGGTLFQALRARLRSVLSLRDALTNISQQHLASELQF
jgi:hypothetical protein